MDEQREQEERAQEKADQLRRDMAAWEERMLMPRKPFAEREAAQDPNERDRIRRRNRSR